MKFSQTCGTAIVPLLSRLVLAFAFTTVGYNKLMKEAEFTSEQKAILEGYGVEVTNPQPMAARGLMVVPVNFQVDDDAAQEAKGTLEQAEDAVKDAAEAAGEKASELGESVNDALRETREKLEALGQDEPGEPGADDAAGTPVVSAEDIEDIVGTGEIELLAETPFRAKGLHKVTLLCHNAGWPQPNRLALLAAVTELVGGAMLLIGFLSRIWAFGLSIAMGVAFYLVSMNINGVATMNPFTFAENIPSFNTLYSQAGLGVLAFGVFLTGAGPVSVDRLFFGKKGPKGGVIEYDEDDEAFSSTGRAL